MGRRSIDIESARPQHLNGLSYVCFALTKDLLAGSRTVSLAMFIRAYGLSAANQITMEKTRTMAFQVPEETFQRLKDYLKRHKVKRRAFVVGLAEATLDNDEAALQAGDDYTDGHTCP